MADTWLTIERAAVTLGLSVRTVNRHISSGKLSSRLHEGRREVLVSAPNKGGEPNGTSLGMTGAPVDMDGAGASVKSSTVIVPETPNVTHSPGTNGVNDNPAEPPAQPSTVSSHNHTASDAEDRQERAPDSEALLVLAENAHQKAELAVRAYQTLARTAEAQVTRSQRSARFAWSVVGLTVIAVVIAVGWTTRRLTTVEINYDNLQSQMNQAAVTADKAGQEAEALRRDVYEANTRAARAEGHAAAVADVVAKRPATSPSTKPSIVNRLTSMMEEGK